MEIFHVALALASAFLHASWNAAVKARPNATYAMTAQMVLAGVLMAPLLFWSGPPALASVPWMIASAAINTVTVTAMLRGYAHASFGLVYPVARAISVLLIVPGAAIMFGERIGSMAIAGVACIATSLGLLARAARSNADADGRAWPWIVLAGVTTALYVLADAQGVRASGTAIGYGCCTSILNAAIMFWRQRNADVSIAAVRREALAMLPVALASVTSYLLILWVYTQAPVAPSSALRDTSALFAVVLAVVWLKEPLRRMQVAALFLAAAAVPLLRLG